MSIALEQVTKTFPSGRTAVRTLTLRAEDGELLALVGPSGCGKSTILRLIAGLEALSSGRILVDERDMTSVPPNERDLAMVFQSYALYPHKTVAQNLAFGLRMRGTARAEIDAKVKAIAESLQIGGLLQLKPGQLSGGQRQRVALGRAIIREPRGFLLDEPLSNLDPQLRVDTRTEIGALHRRLRTTMIYVTHDQEEAMTLGDRIAVLRDGLLEQLAGPLELYQRPANAFVGCFIGSPKMNLLDATICGEEPAGGFGRRLRLEGRGFAVSVNVDAGLAKPTDSLIQLGVRPRDIQLVSADRADATASVILIEPLGHEVIVHAALPSEGGRIVVTADADRSPQPSDTIHLAFRRDRLHLFDKDKGRRLN